MPLNFKNGRYTASRHAGEVWSAWWGTNPQTIGFGPMRYAFPSRAEKWWSPRDSNSDIPKASVLQTDSANRIGLTTMAVRFGLEPKCPEGALV